MKPLNDRIKEYAERNHMSPTQVKMIIYSKYGVNSPNEYDNMSMLELLETGSTIGDKSYWIEY